MEIPKELCLGTRGVVRKVNRFLSRNSAPFKKQILSFYIKIFIEQDHEDRLDWLLSWPCFNQVCLGFATTGGDRSLPIRLLPLTRIRPLSYYPHTLSQTVQIDYLLPFGPGTNSH